MARYLVERTFPDGLPIPAGEEGPLQSWCRRAQRGRGRHVAALVRERRSDEDVLPYDGPTPEAIRKTAARNELPIDRITQVRVLDPHFYVGEETKW